MKRLAIPENWDAANRLDRISLAMSAVLFVSPWLMGYSDMKIAADTAWISAAVIAVVSMTAIVHFAEWEEWINLVAAAWLVVAPWAMGFSVRSDAASAFLAVGFFVALISLAEITDAHHFGSAEG